MDPRTASRVEKLKRLTEKDDKNNVWPISSKSDQNPLGDPNVNKESRETKTKNRVAKKTRLNEVNFLLCFRLFNQMVRERGEKNVFICSYSISVMMAMLRNFEEAEIYHSISDPYKVEELTIQDINEYYWDQNDYIRHFDKNIDLLFANILYHAQTVELPEIFINNLKEYFECEVVKLDFLLPDSINIINSLVASKTNNKITNIVSLPLLPSAKFFLINAIYFKGTWAEKFDVKHTKQGVFFLNNGSSAEVSMMHQKEKFRYFENEDFQAVELPYEGKRVSMYVFLPKNPKQGTEAVQHVNEENYHSWLAEFQEIIVDLSLPRFKATFSDHIHLLLEKMGILNVPDLTSILHNAVIEVNEEGTEAAAVTSFKFYKSYVRNVEMVVDHPFLFTIHHHYLNTILFMGLINDPD